ncbi:Molybdopterin synthase catalytic subunit [Schistosoma japonicum]|uniref:Molybdopterin synthase catalytic subunit n=1 Tax=Schistosoma japonicum TaxID=6182 RepID=Q5D8Y9_SCHJA|nr:SJCHGC05921 protein [Schistosoma japonicum]TNN20344.1 Molybdopterin synthase catalytic subunit [Schistosoma japonicum]TNN20345.1 Molybdopterin synthase catalytic subunit [Schistosoma japonicum]TNN20346.1 Molybdopterin synthase catalytic subunit [Schistosoma japonicum]
MSTQHYIKISIEPIEYSNVFNLIDDSSIGAVATFFGITRKYDKERIVQALNYECYLKMAYLELERIVNNSYKLWPSLIHVIVLHRYGLVPAGEISVAIAVSSPHRKDSLEAVKFLIDSIKSCLPIWKKEIYEDGTSTWKQNNECFWLFKEQNNKHQ